MAQVMCTNDNTKPYRSYHKSIIKEVVRLDSSDSEDCISLDDHNPQISSVSHNISTQTTTKIRPHVNIITHTLDNIDNTSSEDNDQETRPLCSLSLQTPRGYQYFKPKQIRSPSPSPYRKINEQPSRTIASRRTQSIECLPLPKLSETLTNDSGTGDLEVVSTSKSPFSNSYDIVPVFGLPQTTIALMSNRYDFDPRKVEEYRNKKRKSFLKLAFKSSSQSPRRNTTNTSPTTKSENLLSRIMQSLKPPTTNHLSNEPIIRHHSSQQAINEDN